MLFTSSGRLLAAVKLLPINSTFLVVWPWIESVAKARENKSRSFFIGDFDVRNGNLFQFSFPPNITQAPFLKNFEMKEFSNAYQRLSVCCSKNIYRTTCKPSLNIKGILFSVN